MVLLLRGGHRAGPVVPIEHPAPEQVRQRDGRAPGLAEVAEAQHPPAGRPGVVEPGADGGQVDLKAVETAVETAVGGRWKGGGNGRGRATERRWKRQWKGEGKAVLHQQSLMAVVPPSEPEVINRDGSAAV